MSRAATVAAAVVFVVVATTMQLWRLSNENVLGTVWYEDGTVFYSDALDLPLTETFAKSYNGYGHALPRVLAAVGSWLPPEWYSAWVAVSSTVVVSLLALFLYFASAPLLRAPIRRGILAISLLVLPVLSLEVLATLSNLQWTLLIACLFAVLFPVEGWGGISVRALIVVIAPLTSPLSLVATPLALYHLVVFAQRRDTSRRFVVPALYLGACLGQILMIVGAGHRPLAVAGEPAPPVGDVLGDVADLYNVGVLIYGGLGTEVSSELWRSSSTWVGWVAIAVIGMMLLVKLRGAQSTARLWIAGFALASPAFFALTMSQRSGRVAPALSSLPVDTRYWVVPQIFLLVAFLVPPVVDRGLLLGAYRDEGVGFSTIVRESPGRWGVALNGGLPWIALSVFTVAWLAVAVVPSYRHDVGRSELPSWPDQVEAARAACRTDPTAAQVVDVAAPDWRLRMTCDELNVGDPSALDQPRRTTIVRPLQPAGSFGAPCSRADGSSNSRGMGRIPRCA